MKSSTASLLRKLTVSSILLGMAIFFGWRFWEEVTRSIDNVGGIVVGEVQTTQGQVQRRYDREWRWGSLKNDDLVYNLDVIRTSEDAGASLALQTIGEMGEMIDFDISLGPKTTIILDLTGEARNINFVGGSISTTEADGLTLSAGDIVVSADSGTVNLSREAGESTSVSVSDGEALVLADGNLTTLGSDSLLRVDEDTGILVQEKAIISPLFPKPNALLLTYASRRGVDFSWELFADWSNPVLEISSDSAFPAGTVLRPGEGASMDLEPGIWYWRVMDEASGAFGPVNVFSVDTERPVELLSPTDAATHYFRDGPPSLSFRWNTAWYADAYTLELSPTADFDNIPISREVEGSSVLIENLSGDQWWWRVIPHYRRGNLEELRLPPSRTFTLEERSGLDPIVLLSPIDGTILSELDVRGGISLSWRIGQKIDSYRVKVSQNDDLSNLITDTRTAKNWITLLNTTEPGSYFWQVEATAKDGSAVPASEIRRFVVRPVSGSVELLDPEPGQVLELSPFSPHNFIWRSGVSGTSRFLLHRLSGNERTRIIESLISGEILTAPIPGEGFYAWKVQILDAEGRVLVESPEGRFRLQSEFSAPVLVAPRPGESISLVGATDIDLAWTPTPSADAYRVVLIGPNGTPVGRNDRTPGITRTFSIPPSAGPGTYTVELTAIRDNPEPGAPPNSATGTYRFDVGELQVYSAAVPFAPVNGARITALQEGITLGWRQDPPLSRYTVELQGGGVTRLYQSSEPRLLLNGLDAGRYTWTIRSRDSFGQDAPDSSPVSFVVEDLATPADPLVISPRNNENLDMTQAKSLVLEWESAAEAVFHDLALYIKGETAPVLQESGIVGSRYVVEDLEKLKAGDFILHLTARIEYPSLGARRVSQEVRVPFTLSSTIEAAVPAILTNELQYAE